MMKPGLYKAEHKDEYHVHDYEIILDVKETEKSFILKLVKYENRYYYSHVEWMFRDSQKVTIKKDGSKHAMRIWSDSDFTLYPYQAGIPFYFKRISNEDNSCETNSKENKHCRYCNNAYVNEELTHDNDLSYIGVGKSANGYNVYIRSGDNKPTSLIVSMFDKTVNRNVDMCKYDMKYCPECGRRLFENK